MEDKSYVGYKMAATSVILSGTEGHIRCLKPL